MWERLRVGERGGRRSIFKMEKVVLITFVFRRNDWIFRGGEVS